MHQMYPKSGEHFVLAAKHSEVTSLDELQIPTHCASPNQPAVPESGSPPHGVAEQQAASDFRAYLANCSLFRSFDLTNRNT